MLYELEFREFGSVCTHTQLQYTHVFSTMYINVDEEIIWKHCPSKVVLLKLGS